MVNLKKKVLSGLSVVGMLGVISMNLFSVSAEAGGPVSFVYKQNGAELGVYATGTMFGFKVAADMDLSKFEIIDASAKYANTKIDPTSLGVSCVSDKNIDFSSTLIATMKLKVKDGVTDAKVGAGLKVDDKNIGYIDAKGTRQPVDLSKITASTKQAGANQFLIDVAQVRAGTTSTPSGGKLPTGDNEQLLSMGIIAMITLGGAILCVRKREAA